MSFVSISFAFYFLPIVFFLYWICSDKLKPYFLFLAGIIFYSWGNMEQVLVLLYIILINWLLGILVKKSKLIYVTGIIFNVFTLIEYKFFDTGLGFPLGVSFYVFHAISYLTDIHRGKTGYAKNPIHFALYLSLFTKITMGPIVKYSDMDYQLKNLQNPSAEQVSRGAVDFAVGFAKKAVLASSLSAIVTNAWPDAVNSTLSAWIGIAAYTLQLYFDFSGYTDMARGLSSMLGIEIPENFRYPYLSTSVSEFWRRWHITLGAWFREYLYVPMGGSRVSGGRVLFNLLIVWIATGIWHGSGLNFIIWGLWHCLFVCMEKLVFRKFKLPGLFGWAYTIFVVMLGWVLFNSANLNDGISYISYLFGYAADVDNTYAEMILHDNMIILGVSLIGATNVPKEIARRLFDGLPEWFVTAAKIILISGLLYLSVTTVLSEGYTPFIYTEF